MSDGNLFRSAPGLAELQPTGRLSMYWCLPDYLPVPQHWTCRLVDIGDGTLLRTSGIEKPTYIDTVTRAADIADGGADGVAPVGNDVDVDESDSELVRRDLVAQARYHQVPYDVDAVSTLADLAQATGLPHSTAESPPTWTDDALIAVARPEAERLDDETAPRDPETHPDQLAEEAGPEPHHPGALSCKR